MINAHTHHYHHMHHIHTHIEKYKYPLPPILSLSSLHVLWYLIKDFEKRRITQK